MAKSKIYLDLSKCTEEEIKETYKKIKNSDQNIHTQTKRDLINGIVTHCYWFLFFDGNAWNQNETPLSGKTEITYPEFIKLFEGGETVKSDNTQTLHNALEQIEKLESDKAELLGMLQRIINIYPILVEEDKEELLKAKSLIQKHKQ